MRGRAGVAMVLAVQAAICRLGAQDPSFAQWIERVRDTQLDAEPRCLALCALQDRGGLDVATVIAALGDADASVAMTAAAIVRHQWPVLPQELFDGLDGAPAAAAALLRELAIAPRPGAAAWARAYASRAGITDDVACLALAAVGQDLTLTDAKVLMTALQRGEVDDGFHVAAGLLPAKVADALLGKVHAMLAQQQIDLSQATPILDRLSPAGYERLLGLAVTLPPALGEEICLRLAQRAVPAYDDRAVAALDGKIPLEAAWLLRAGRLLAGTGPVIAARRERLFAVLADAKADAHLQSRAFDALLDGVALDASIVEPRLWDYALSLEDKYAAMRRLLDVAVQNVPEARLLDWLDGTPELARVTVLALQHRPVLGAGVERALMRMIQSVQVVEGVFLDNATAALLTYGSETSVRGVWPLVRHAPAFVPLLDTLVRRGAPFVHELLLTELAAPDDATMAAPAREQQRDAFRLALCSLGDRRQIAELVQHAKTAAPNFLRKCAHRVQPLDGKLAMQLLDDAEQITDDDRAAELIGWAATSAAPEVTDRLVKLWQAPELSERQEVALRALASGPHRQRMQRDLCEAAEQGPLSERFEQLAYEIVSGMPSPLSADDARVLAKLALRTPMLDAEGERARAERWPDGRNGFPFIGAIAQRLRGVDPAVVHAAFAEVADQVRTDARVAAVSRQRLLVLWRSLEADREAMIAVGTATAALLLTIPHAEGLGCGAAHWLLLQQAQAASDPAAAATHARPAVAGLLRLSEDRRSARLFLGERDPGAGEDPWAALAATPFLCDAEAALAAGDRAAAQRAIALAREFVGRDAATASSIESVAKELTR